MWTARATATSTDKRALMRRPTSSAIAAGLLFVTLACAGAWWALSAGGPTVDGHQVADGPPEEVLSAAGA